jgi:hypothetical protein
MEANPNNGTNQMPFGRQQRKGHALAVNAQQRAHISSGMKIVTPENTLKTRTLTV